MVHKTLLKDENIISCTVQSIYNCMQNRYMYWYEHLFESEFFKIQQSFWHWQTINV